MPIVVRAAGLEDAHAIADIHVRGWQAAYHGIVPQGFLAGLSPERRREQWLRRIGEPTSPEARVWVAVQESRVAAFASTGPSRDDDVRPDVGELFAIYADPERWGTGAGRAAMIHVLADFTARGLAGGTLWVVDVNARARRFYEIAGLRADGSEKLVAFSGTVIREVRYRWGSVPGRGPCEGSHP